MLYLGDVGGQEKAGHRPPAGVVEDGAPQQRVSAHRASALLLRATGGSQLRGTWGQNIELMHVKPFIPFSTNFNRFYQITHPEKLNFVTV